MAEIRQKLIKEDEFDLVIQVSGKTRYRESGKGIIEADALELLYRRKVLKGLSLTEMIYARQYSYRDRLINIII